MPAASVATAVAAGGLLLGGVPVAVAAGETLTVTLKQETGLGPFDADDAAGHDSSASNDIVRTNDSVTYIVGVRFEGGAQTKPTIKFTLPQGEVFDGLPGFCLAGSSVTPTSLPDPVIPVTATSWTSLPSQTVTCVVADQNQGTSLDYKFSSRVRPEVPNGTALTPVKASVTSDQVTTAAESGTVAHTVSAAANFDVSKRLNSGADTSGPFYQFYNACSFDAARSCVEMDFPLTIAGPAGGKGLTPLASPITVTDDLSPDAFFGAGTTTSAAWLAAGAGALDKYAPRLTFCNGGSANLHGALPNSSGGSLTEPRGVRDSGTITCPQPTLGTPVDITFTNADTTGYTVPTKSTDGLALPSDLGLVISTAVRLELPLDAVTDLGTTVDGAANLDWKNQYTNFVAADVNGSPNQGEVIANNTRSGNTNVRSNGSFDKLFSGVTGAPGNTLTTSQIPSNTGGYTAFQFEGPPGSSTAHDGNTVVLPGQTVLSNLLSIQNIPPNTGTQFSTSKVVCDVWDDTKLGLPQSFNYAGSTSTDVQKPSNGSPVWISGFHYNSGQWDADLADLANLSIQYSSTATPGSGAGSDCTTGTWYSSPDQVPGATLVNGLWKGVNRVRVSFSTKASSTDSSFEVNTSIALTVLSTAGTTGTILPNWASQYEAKGVKDRDAVLANPDAGTALSSYTAPDNTGGLGDRLIVGAAVARIKKFVGVPGTGDFTDTAVPQYTAGSNVKYRLNPSLTADVSASGTSANVTVEDCLPRYQTFVSSARESGAAITPVLVQSGSPAGAGLSCPVGQTYIRWDLGSNEIGKVIDPIIYTVEILATVRNGDYINTTLVSSDSDPSAASLRTDTAQIKVVVPTGIKIAKSVDKPVVEVNPEGVSKPRDFTWTIDFANIDAPQNVSDVDMIDVLPSTGVNGSKFTGTLALNTITPSATTTGLSIQYTKTAASTLNPDPQNPSNAGSGSTVWCTAPSGGSVASGAGTGADCPASLAEVTGLRFLRPGAFTADMNLTVNIAMTPVGNSAGDVYENRTSGRVNGVTQPVGPAVRKVQVVASSIGDYVWVDLNSNGLQDTGEPALAGFKVKLTGTDVDGNAVTRSTTTDGSGKYLFDNLASGTYTVTFDKSGLKPGQKFTLRNAGDAASDSDGDPATGATGPISLGVNEQLRDIDQGIIAAPATLTVSKTVTGKGSPGPYTFTVTCTLNGQPYTLAAKDATFTLSHGQSHTIHLISGVDCTVKEKDAPATATVIINDSDTSTPEGATDGILTSITGAATVKITNAYEAPHPGLKISKLVSTNETGPWSEKVTIPSGGTVYWQLTVTNTGNTILSDVRIDDPSLGAIEPIGSLAPGQTVTRVIAQHNVGNSYTNVATITGKTPDKTPVTGKDTAEVVIDGGILAYTGAGGITAIVAGALLVLCIGGAVMLVARRRRAI